jgi:multidrug efflux pump subunit AcrA (membrane-fusion protein)
MPGTAAHATIQGRTVQNAMLIPSEAVQRSTEGAGKVVMVVDADGTAKRRSVTVGIANSESTQILDGLRPGDTVITTGGYGLDEGTKVTIVAAGTKKDEDDKSGEKP